ncbi:hypothetical protein J6590_001921, partial [Homalodisca vitripennis]
MWIYRKDHPLLGSEVLYFSTHVYNTDTGAQDNTGRLTKPRYAECIQYVFRVRRSRKPRSRLYGISLDGINETLTNVGYPTDVPVYRHGDLLCNNYTRSRASPAQFVATSIIHALPLTLLYRFRGMSDLT